MEQVVAGRLVKVLETQVPQGVADLACLQEVRQENRNPDSADEAPFRTKKWKGASS